MRLQHGVAEPKADTSSNRVETEQLQVAAMFEELMVTDVKVEKVIRPGKNYRRTGMRTVHPANPDC